MHILVLADAIDNQSAGIHVYTKKLIENLLKIDKKNTYTFVHCEENDFFMGLDHHIVKKRKGRGRSSFRRAISLPNLINKIKPDIIWEPCHIPPYRISKKIKTAVTIHDITPILLPKFHTFRGKLIHRLFLRRIIKNADLILTPSKTTRRDIKKLYKTDAKFAVTPLGVDKPNLKAPKPKTRRPYLLFVGTLEPRKNLELLIDAFLELKTEHHIPHKLVLAGNIGWKNKALLRKAKHQDIEITGHITELKKASYYKHADVFIYPSIYEGFGLPPLEAMSYGTPVICSTGGSLKEIFHGHALTFKPTDKKTLKRHIYSLIKFPHKRRALAEKGLAYSKDFTWRKTAEQTLKAFKKLT